MTYFAIVTSSPKRPVYRDIIDELMDISNINNKRNKCNDENNMDLNISSFKLDELLNNFETNNTNNRILVNTLKSQVKFLQLEATEKNVIINRLINIITLKNEGRESCRQKSSFTFQQVKSSLPSHSQPNESDLDTDKNMVDVDVYEKACEGDVESDYDEYPNIYNRKRSRRKLPSDKIADTGEKSYRDIDRGLKKLEHVSDVSYNDVPIMGVQHNPYQDPNFAAWETHTTCFGSKMLKKMGYAGRGLGKTGNGIVNPITIADTKPRSLVKAEVQNYRIHRTYRKVHPWPKGTTLIAGSSLLLGINEGKLQKYKCKVRPFPGSTIDDMYDYLNPLLKKNPSNIILHIGSNDALDKTTEEIANEIIHLKEFIESVLPSVKIFWSCPILRLDNMKANTVLRELSQWLKFFTNNVIDNNNIDGTCIGKKGLHLNAKGSGRLAINLISLMKRL